MKVAIVIGVDRVSSGLPTLRAAASGAREVGIWLQRNGYRVEVFADDTGPVTRSDIFRAILAHVEAANVKRLVVYFAGHGFLKGPLDEFWLLSGSLVDPAEAVNVSLSSRFARYHGIPEIVFISDACRVTPKTAVNASIIGASIFPNIQTSAGSAEIDLYFATRPGDPAHERKATEAKRAHGLFTQVFLDAHKDAPAEAILAFDGREYVSNIWLKRVLGERVDDRAQGCCQTNAHQSPIGGVCSLIGKAQSMRLRHSANAAERSAL